MNRLTERKGSRAATDRNHGQEHRECCGERATTPPLLLTLALALGLITVMVSLVGGPSAQKARAMPGDPPQSVRNEIGGGVIRVATSGEDTPGCGAEGNE